MQPSETNELAVAKEHRQLGKEEVHALPTFQPDVASPYPGAPSAEEHASLIPRAW